MVSFVVLIHDYWTLYICSFDSCSYNVCDKKQYHYLFILYFLFGSLLPLLQGVLILVDDRLKISFSIKELMGFAGYFILGYYLFRYDLSHRVKNGFMY